MLAIEVSSRMSKEYSRMILVVIALKQRVDRTAKQHEHGK